MAGKFGQQISGGKAGQQVRLTRTQRVIQSEEELKRKRQQEAEFRALQEEAQRLQSTEFSNITLDKYAEKYNLLSPELKQFFTSPQELVAQREAELQGEKQEFEKRIQAKKEMLQSLREAKEKANQIYFNRDSRFQEETRDYHNETIRNYDDRIAELEDAIEYAKSNAYRIDEGVSATEIIKEVSYRARLEREAKEQQYAQEKKFSYEVKTGKYDQDLSKLGLQKKDVTLKLYSTLSEKYNQNIQANVREEVRRWEQENPTEKLTFDPSGNITTVASGRFGKTVPLEEYQKLVDAENKRIEKLGTQTLKLTTETELPPKLVSEWKPFTKEQIEVNTYLMQEKSYLNKGLDIIQQSFGFGVQQTSPTMKFETKEFAPNITGTISSTKQLTPQSQDYTSEVIKRDIEGSKVADQVSTDYYAKLNALKLDEITPERLDTIRTEAQSNFRKQMEVIDQNFARSYEAKVKKRKIEEQEKGEFGGIVKTYRKYITDPELELAGTVKIPTESEMRLQSARNYSSYIKKGYPKWLASELTGAETTVIGFGYGAKKEFLERPRSFGFKLLATAGVVAGTKVALTYSGGTLGKIAQSTGAKAVGNILTGIWAGSVVVRTSAGASSYERGMILGEITSGEIVPILAGGYAGTKVAEWGVSGIERYNIMRQNARQIAEYKRVRMSVLRGEEKFPTAPRSKQFGEFKKAKYSLLTDEKRLLASGSKVKIRAGSHATTVGRFAKVGEKYVAGAGSSEIPAQYYSSEDSLYFALGKGQTSSFYGGSIFGSAVPKPYVEAYRSAGFVRIPKGYRPKMTKTEVIEYLKKYAPDYPLGSITRAKGSYWRETAFMIERGRTGELIVPARKSEIEAVKMFGTVAERTPQKPYFTRVKSPEIYKDLTKIRRLGRTEYVYQVKPLKAQDVILMKTKEFSLFNKRLGQIKYPTVNPILKTRIWDRVVPNIRGGKLRFGKPIGQFKSLRFGRIVPIERYKYVKTPKALEMYQIKDDQQLMEKIKEAVGKGTPEFQRVSTEAERQKILTRGIRQINEYDPLYTTGRLPKSAKTYSEEYASMIRYPKRSVSYKSPSYSRSYTSSVKSAISSILSSNRSAVSSGGISSGGYSGGGYTGGSSIISPPYSPPSYTPPSYVPPYKPPRPPRTKISFGEADVLKKQIKKKGKVIPEIQALFPDFTARALGLAPKRVKSVKEALKEINRLQTGFEVRTGARLQGYSPIDEKSLMRGIMK